MSTENIQYSTKYEDDVYIYRHVILPDDMAKLVPITHLMTETEWRNLGIQMTSGWVHYMRYDPGEYHEPHIIPFRKSKIE